MDQTKKIEALEKQLKELKSVVKPAKSAPEKSGKKVQPVKTETAPAARTTPTKTKPKGNKGIIIGILIGIIVVLVGVGGLFGYEILSSDSYRIRDQKYEIGYNYGDLTEAPWFSKSGDLSDFKERQALMDEMGISMDGDYYQEVMEADLEALLASLDSESDLTSSGSTEVSDADYYSGDGEAEETPEGGEILSNDQEGYEFMVEDASRWNYEQQWSQAGGTDYTFYEYCYQLDDASYEESWMCGTGYASLFAISVMDQQQWMAYQDSEFGDHAELLGSAGGLYYIYEESYTDKPVEVDMELIYQMLMGSFVVE